MLPMTGKQSSKNSHCHLHALLVIVRLFGCLCQQTIPQFRPPEPIRLSANDVLLEMDKIPPRESSTYQIEWNTEQELQQLIQQLDPIHDYVREANDTSVPEVSLSRVGASIRRQQRSKDNKAQLRRDLRPALAAMCPTSISIPWHERFFQSEPYFSTYLQHLGAARNRDRFYHDLVHHTEMIMQIDDRGKLNSIHHILDERIVPYLQRYCATGTDHNLEALCSMAARVDAPGIDAVIEQLFRRWLGQFDKASKQVPEADNYAFWSSLGNLSSHARFREIPDYDLQLAELLELPIPAFHKEMIVRILSECPRAYVHLEMLLLKATPFEHFAEDEVDRLDAAADALFNRVAED